MNLQVLVTAVKQRGPFWWTRVAWHLVGQLCAGLLCVLAAAAAWLGLRPLVSKPFEFGRQMWRSFSKGGDFRMCQNRGTPQMVVLLVCHWVCERVCVRVLVSNGGWAQQRGAYILAFPPFFPGILLFRISLEVWI